MARKRSKNLIGLVASVTVMLVAPVLGVAITMILVRLSFRSTEGVDPSQKARVLAEGISEAMNGAAFGMVISVLALIPTIVFAVRLVRESKRNKE